jgi:hypothetical protein
MGLIEKFTADSIEQAIRETQNSSHSRKEIYMGHLQCMINRLNNEELTIEQIESIGLAAQDLGQIVRKGNK